MFIQLYNDFSVLGISASANLCYLCGSPKHADADGVVSTGVSIDFEGALEVCQNCVMEAAYLFGAIAPDKAEALRLKNRSLGAQLRAAQSVEESLRAQIVALGDQIEALRDAVKK